MIKKRISLVLGCAVICSLLTTGCTKDNDNVSDSEEIESHTTESVLETESDTEYVSEETILETEDIMLYVENAPELTGLEIQGNLMMEEQKDDFETEDLTLLHKYEQAGVSLYTYESMEEIGPGYETNIPKVVFEYNGTYTVYSISIDLTVEDEYTYDEYDYDGDGVLEVGAALMTNHGSGYYRDTQVYIFDFNEEKDAYELYYTKIEDYAHSVNKEIIKLYKEKEGIDYEIISTGEIVDGRMLSYKCSMRAENGNPIRLDSVVFKFNNGGEIDARILIYEALPERQIEGGDYVDTGSLVYSISYNGDGMFSFSNTQLKRNELYY